MLTRCAYQGDVAYPRDDTAQNYTEAIKWLLVVIYMYHFQAYFQLMPVLRIVGPI